MLVLEVQWRRKVDQGEPHRRFSYASVDPNGSLIAKHNDTSGEHVTYSYNLENRLIAADIARVEKDSQGRKAEGTGFF